MQEAKTIETLEAENALLRQEQRVLRAQVASLEEKVMVLLQQQASKAAPGARSRKIAITVIILPAKTK